MIVTYTDSNTERMVFTPANCTGYRASSIELEPMDVRAMIRWLDQDPGTLRIALAQLEARWPLEDLK